MFKKLPHSYHIFRNILYTFASVFLFFSGVIVYGIILNMREVPLSEALKEKGLTEVKNPSIVVDRKNYALHLYSDNELIKSYRAVFGKNTSSEKKSADDHVTPVGTYKICSIDTNSKYHKFLQLNYPNQRDAAEALRKGYINGDEFKRIIETLNKNNIPCSSTSLGAEIGIQGCGEYDFIFRNLPFAFNWTNGSIAVSNKNIDEIYNIIKPGTKIEIRY